MPLLSGQAGAVWGHTSKSGQQWTDNCFHLIFPPIVESHNKADNLNDDKRNKTVRDFELKYSDTKQRRVLVKTDRLSVCPEANIWTTDSDLTEQDGCNYRAVG
jgi:hypothetical protein